MVSLVPAKNMTTLLCQKDRYSVRLGVLSLPLYNIYSFGTFTREVDSSENTAKYVKVKIRQLEIVAFNEPSAAIN